MTKGLFINEVCAMFDISVLTDIEGDLSDSPIRVVVALGERAETAAGLVGYVMTPWFSTEDELDKFCEQNINRFHIAAAECELGAAVPDATEWR